MFHVKHKKTAMLQFFFRHTQYLQSIKLPCSKTKLPFKTVKVAKKGNAVDLFLGQSKAIKKNLQTQNVSCETIFVVFLPRVQGLFAELFA